MGSGNSNDYYLRNSREECKHSYQCINGSYCTLHHKLVEYKRTPCKDYAEKKTITRGSAGTEGLAK